MVSPPESVREALLLLALLFTGALVAGFTVVALYGAATGGRLGAAQAALLVGVAVGTAGLVREIAKRQ